MKASNIKTQKAIQILKRIAEQAGRKTTMQNLIITVLLTEALYLMALVLTQ